MTNITHLTSHKLFHPYSESNANPLVGNNTIESAYILAIYSPESNIHAIQGIAMYTHRVLGSYKVYK